MNILLATFWSFPHIGGVSSHLETLKEELKCLGHSVYLFSINTVFELAKQWKISIPQGQTFSQKYDILRQLYEYIAKNIPFEHIDLIHAHDVVVAEIFGRISSKPLVTTVHGYLTREALSDRVILKGSAEEEYLLDIERRAIEETDHFIAVDKNIHHYLCEELNCQKPVSLIRNFVPRAFFENINQKDARSKLGLSMDDFIILSPRRLVEKNGVLYGVRAMAHVLRKIPNAKLLILGNGPQRSLIESAIRENNLESAVYILGEIPHHLISTFLDASDIVLIPSVPSKGVEEATSIAALEGMAKGKTVIASAIGGLRELIENGKTGFLVPPFDENAIADTIIEVFRDYRLRHEIGCHAKRYVWEYHASQNVVQKILSVYQNAQVVSSHYRQISADRKLLNHSLVTKAEACYVGLQVKAVPIPAVTEAVANWDTVTADQFLEAHAWDKFCSILTETEANVVLAPVVYDVFPGHRIARWEVVAKRRGDSGFRTERILTYVRGGEPRLPYDEAYKEFIAGHYERAFTVFHRLFDGAKTLENQAVFVRWMALCLIEMGKDSEAIHLLENAVRLCPTYTDLWYLLFVALGLAGQIKRLEPVYQAVMAVGDATGYPEFFVDVRQLVLERLRD